jgi:thiamine monophosphate synthase
VVLVVLVDNVLVLLHVHKDKVEQVVHVQVELVALLLIVQVEILVAEHQEVHQVDLIVRDNVQVLAVAEILQVHSVRVDLRRAITRRVRKRCVMISKTCKRLHLAA